MDGLDSSLHKAAPTVASTRRLNGEDRALINTSSWCQVSDLKLEDHVSLADANAVFLQGVVAYVGEVHFGEGIWVGVQLTGPSVSKGQSDGAFHGKRYFSKVGRKNGMLVPISKVHKRIPTQVFDPELERLQQLRKTSKAQIAEVNYVEALKKERQIALLKRNDIDSRRPRVLPKTKFDKEEAYIQRLKQERLNELRASRGDEPLDIKVHAAPKLRFSGVNAKLCDADLNLVEGLQEAQQNFCLTDPTLPDNPITFASQAFLNMTGYHLNEILGRNCRFLQGPETDPEAIQKIRKSIEEGSDCSLTILNYRSDGTTFWNNFYICALRDTRGRIKNYVGVQCEVPSPEVVRQQQQQQSMVPPPTPIKKVPMRNEQDYSPTSSSGDNTPETDDESLEDKHLDPFYGSPQQQQQPYFQQPMHHSAPYFGGPPLRRGRSDNNKNNNNDEDYLFTPQATHKPRQDFPPYSDGSVPRKSSRGQPRQQPSPQELSSNSWHASTSNNNNSNNNNNSMHSSGDVVPDLFRPSVSYSAFHRRASAGGHISSFHSYPDAAAAPAAPPIHKSKSRTKSPRESPQQHGGPRVVIARHPSNVHQQTDHKIRKKKLSAPMKDCRLRPPSIDPTFDERAVTPKISHRAPSSTSEDDGSTTTFMTFDAEQPYNNDNRSMSSPSNGGMTKKKKLKKKSRKPSGKPQQVV